MERAPAGRDPCLGHVGFDIFGSPNQFSMWDLDCHNPVQSLVTSQKDTTERSLAQRFLDPIPADAGGHFNRITFCGRF